MSSIVPDFDAMYAERSDPWQVETSWYERRKLDLLLACLPHQRYLRAWEPGCGIGVATEALAARVDELVASDPASRAVARTEARTAGLPQVRVVQSQLPATAVDEPVDLVVVAEFLYYVEEVEKALSTLWSVCSPGAHLVVLHWAHHPHDAFMSGRHTNALVVASARERGADHVIEHRDQSFVLDVFEVAR